MIDNLLCVSMSTLEIVTIFAFMLSLFRFKLRPNLLPLLYLAIPMSIVSLYIRITPPLESFKPILMYLLFFLSVKLLFGLRILQTLLVTIVGYVGYGFLQIALVNLFVAIGIVSIEDVTRIGFSSLFVQFISTVVTAAIVMKISSERWGFTFVGQQKIVFKDTVSYRMIIISLFLSATLFSTMLKINNLMIAMLALAADFYFLLLFLMKKEIED